MNMWELSEIWHRLYSLHSSLNSPAFIIEALGSMIKSPSAGSLTQIVPAGVSLPVLYAKYCVLWSVSKFKVCISGADFSSF